MAIKRVGIEQARKSLGDLTNEVRFSLDTTVVLTRNGQPVARIAPVMEAISTIRAHLTRHEGETWQIDIRTATWTGDETGWETDPDVAPIDTVTTGIPNTWGIQEAEPACCAIMYVAGWEAVGNYEGNTDVLLVRRVKPPVGRFTHVNELHRIVDEWFNGASPEAKTFAFQLVCDIADDQGVARNARQAALITRLMQAERAAVTDELVRLYRYHVTPGDSADFVRDRSE
ncbi:type II toxin-antitoxin system Phd/YefM family antitoxin [Streptomyces xanthophaeus]|uniref:type II toxin-antitoxin system Phd/YefM family antitoxin n=1 Tax=Streptomyces xanthophaeus TaxID=67385 RepID=UPI0036CDB8B4